MKILELNHVAIAVRDVPASVAYYRDVLGLPEIERPAFPFPGAWFRLGQHQELHLIGEREGPPGEGHLALWVPDIAEAERELRARGARFSGPQRRPDGVLQLFLTDPDGNAIELCAGLPAVSP